MRDEELPAQDKIIIAAIEARRRGKNTVINKAAASMFRASAYQNAFRDASDKAQHGAVRVIVKDGQFQA